MSKRPSSTKLRRECFEAHRFADPQTGRWLLTCHLCKLPFNPAVVKWDAEHVVRRILSEDDSTANVLPAHYECHKPKTARDVAENAKGKRVSDRHFNIKQSSGFGWNKRWRKKINGEVVER